MERERIVYVASQSCDGMDSRYNRSSPEPQYLQAYFTLYIKYVRGARWTKSEMQVRAIKIAIWWRV